MRYGAAFAFLAVCILLCACSAQTASLGPKKEAVEYGEQTIKIEGAGELKLDVDFSNIQIYTWEKNELKIETVKKLRGQLEEALLASKMKSFKTEITREKGKILFKSVFKGKITEPRDKSLDVKLYLPRSIKLLAIKLGTGSIKAFDDLQCSLAVETGEVDADINKLDGKVTMTGKRGNLKIGNGKLKAGSAVKTGRGNLNIKAELEPVGEYAFESEIGNIDLNLPANSQISVDSIGNVETDEFNTAEASAKVRLQSGLGKISVRKY